MNNNMAYKRSVLRAKANKFYFIVLNAFLKFENLNNFLHTYINMTWISSHILRAERVVATYSTFECGHGTTV